uniref:Uncharacterized protein n=1 Tax=viral metagenome TaxID=1070528 RepID=A0A6M3J6J6_9ZZZZ
MIHISNGNHSLAQCYKLHQRLEEGIIILSDLQQMHQDSRGYKETLPRLIDVVMDIANAFGINIEIKEK